MGFLLWILRIAVFIALFGLAIKNSDTVELRFFLERSLHAPLSLVLLATFAAGAAVGLTVAFATLVRQSRQLARLTSRAAETEKQPGMDA
jgi:uncharacterized integral membrane protein